MEMQTGETLMRSSLARWEGKRMKATVNEACVACGLCIGTCPQVFSMGADGFSHGSEFDPALLETVQMARDGCPVSAISIVE